MNQGSSFSDQSDMKVGCRGAAVDVWVPHARAQKHRVGGDLRGASAAAFVTFVSICSPGPRGFEERFG